jgi:Tfp pilus assembly protein PilV
MKISGLSGARDQAAASTVVKSLRFNSAFTLIETLLAIILFSVSIPVLCMLVNSGIEAVFTSGYRCEAFNLARSEIEKARNLGYQAIGNVFYSGYEGSRYDLSRRVELIAGNSGGEGIKKITVSLTVPGQSGKEPVVLTTYITSDMR